MREDLTSVRVVVSHWRLKGVVCRPAHLRDNPRLATNLQMVFPQAFAVTPLKVDREQDPGHVEHGPYLQHSHHLL
jgi:hypothetical protein